MARRWSQRSRSDLLWTSLTRCLNGSHRHWRRSWNRLQRIQINRVGYLRRLHFRRVRRGSGPRNSLCLWSEVHQAPYHLQWEWPSHCLSPLGAHIRSRFSKRVRNSNHVLARVSILRRLTLRRSSCRLHELVFDGDQRRLRDLFDLCQSVEVTLHWWTLQCHIKIKSDVIRVRKGGLGSWVREVRDGSCV